mmetsp:Transcript_7853/g.14282  ORF Transcript_7853/g.14282 Transcript_7853/m.14282 type:complete len:280 (-) Transcript_7853:435-1274(-)
MTLPYIFSNRIQNAYTTTWRQNSLLPLIHKDGSNLFRITLKHAQSLFKLVHDAGIRRNVQIPRFFCQCKVRIAANSSLFLGVDLHCHGDICRAQNLQKAHWQRHLIDTHKSKYLIEFGNRIHAYTIRPIRTTTSRRGTKRCWHADRIISIFLEIRVHSLGTQYSRICSRNIRGASRLGLAPIEDASWKGTHGETSSLRSRRHLKKGKHQSNVGSNALLFQSSCCLNPLPCSRKLNHDTILVNSHFLVHLNKSLGTSNTLLRVVRLTDVHFGVDTSRNQF